jgi:hypothetical protein
MVVGPQSVLCCILAVVIHPCEMAPPLLLASWKGYHRSKSFHSLLSFPEFRMFDPALLFLVFNFLTVVAGSKEFNFP